MKQYDQVFEGLVSGCEVLSILKFKFHPAQ